MASRLTSAALGATLVRMLGETDVELGNRIHKELEAAMSRPYDSTNMPKKQRFGVVERNFGALGELRKQLKAPNKEVFYTWVEAKQGEYYGLVLRSICNCSNEQIIDSIRTAGENMSKGYAAEDDCEFVLDLLYAELARRVKV